MRRHATTMGVSIVPTTSGSNRHLSSAVEQWILEIPNVHESIVCIEGRWLGRSAADVSIVVEGACMRFAAEDVISVRLGRGQRPGRDQVILRVGAMLIDANRLEDARDSHRPFALAVRPTVPECDSAPRFEAAERRFLSTHGVIVS